MNKVILIEKVATAAKINKAAAGRAVLAIIKEITQTLKQNGKVAIAGLGAFKVKTRKARTGRNPKTGASVQIPARKVPVFKASTTLKNAVR